MNMEQHKEYHALRSIIEVHMDAIDDNLLIALLKRNGITPELKDIIVEELRTRVERLQDAIISFEGDIPREYIPEFEGTLNQLENLLS